MYIQHNQSQSYHKKLGRWFYWIEGNNEIKLFPFKDDLETLKNCEADIMSSCTPISAEDEEVRETCFKYADDYR